MLTDILANIIFYINKKNFFNNDAIEPLLNKLEADTKEIFCLSKAAQTAHISKFHLLRKLTKATGLTPHRFHLQNRLRKAQRLLETECSLTEIALLSGFYDQSHFIKSFKQLFNVTPSFYRNHCLLK